MAPYPKPGRGAWRTTGGLLPAKPGSSSSAGYYRLATGTETPVGSAFINGTDTSHHAEVVTLGVMAIQNIVGVAADGWFGPVSATKVAATQKRMGVEADGIVGRQTMRAVLTPVVTQLAARLQIPVAVLGGLLVNESALDPAAVGVNGLDHGLAQINLGAHPEISLTQAMDPAYAIEWTAEDLDRVHNTWSGRTSVDPWMIAVAHHNSPLLAKRWAMAGEAPIEKGRSVQIQEYVDRVLAAW